MTDGPQRPYDQPAPGDRRPPVGPRHSRRVDRRLTVPPRTTPATPGARPEIGAAVRREYYPVQDPPIAAATLEEMRLKLEERAAKEPGIFDIVMDDTPVKIRRKKGTTTTPTPTELQELLKVDPPEKIVLTPEIIKAILANPKEKLKIRVAAVTPANEWLVALESEIKAGTLPEDQDEWTGGTQHVQTDAGPIALPSGISVHDSLREVPDILKGLFREIYRTEYNSILSDRVLTALIGQWAHESHEWPVGYNKERRVSSGRIDAYSQKDKHIHELKSNNPRELIEGACQVVRYLADLAIETGEEHTGDIQFYYTTETINT